FEKLESGRVSSGRRPLVLLNFSLLPPLRPKLKRRHVVEAAVGPFLIVIPPITLSQHPRLAHVVEPLAIQTLIPETRVKAFGKTVLPGTTRLNIGCLHSLRF